MAKTLEAEEGNKSYSNKRCYVLLYNFTLFSSHSDKTWKFSKKNRFFGHNRFLYLKAKQVEREVLVVVNHLVSISFTFKRRKKIFLLVLYDEMNLLETTVPTWKIFFSIFSKASFFRPAWGRGREKLKRLSNTKVVAFFQYVLILNDSNAK